MRSYSDIHSLLFNSRIRLRYLPYFFGCFIISITLSGQSFPLDIPTLPPGDSIVISYNATVNPNLSPDINSVSCQIEVTADGSISVLSDDPDTPQFGDATSTELAPIPTLSEWGLIVLGMFLWILGTVAIKDRTAAVQT